MIEAASIQVAVAAKLIRVDVGTRQNVRVDHGRHGFAAAALHNSGDDLTALLHHAGDGGLVALVTRTLARHGTADQRFIDLHDLTDPPSGLSPPTSAMCFRIS